MVVSDLSLDCRWPTFREKGLFGCLGSKKIRENNGAMDFLLVMRKMWSNEWSYFILFVYFFQFSTCLCGI